MGTWLQVREDQDPRRWDNSHGWLKRARSAKEEETIFHWCMRRLGKYHLDLFVVTELWFRGAVSVAQHEQREENEP